MNSEVLSITTASINLKAYNLFNFKGLNLTNSVLTSWIISFLMILFIKLVIRSKPSIIPSKGQVFIEIIIEEIKKITQPIVGNKIFENVFPILISFFCFIFMQNISGLIPGVGAFGHYNKNNEFIYYFRPGNADINMTLALSIIAFISWLYFIFKFTTFKNILHDFFGNKAEKKGISSYIYYPLFIVFFIIGLIEIISISFRIVSLSFRLFGNVFGGENLLHSIHNICAYLLPVPFYLLEILISFIQALVFTLLVAVYIGLVCNHHDEKKLNLQ